LVAHKLYFKEPFLLIELAIGGAGTGKSTFLSARLTDNPLWLCNANSLANAHIDKSRDAITLASFHRYRPLGPATWHLHPSYRQEQIRRMFIHGLPEIPDVIPKHLLTPENKKMYCKQQEFGPRSIFTHYDKRHERMHIFDDCSLYGRLITLHTIKWIDKHYKNAAPIGISYDPAQISYGGHELVSHLLKKHPLDVNLKICKKAFRFEGAKYTWVNFTYGEVPLYTQCPQDFNGMFVGHSIKSVDRALLKGFSSKRSINVDKAQGREWGFTIVDLFGMLALVDNKILGWQARIYTTMTRGKEFGF
jgi:hypothetical protein